MRSVLRLLASTVALSVGAFVIPIAAPLERLLVAELAAQGTSVRVVVADSLGERIPYALVQPANGVARSANDSGYADFSLAAHDSLRFIVRRVGYAPYEGWLQRRGSGSEYHALLVALPRTLVRVTVTERADTPLGRAGFYDRMERVRRGAYSARFITPEELEMKNPTRVSSVLAGETLVRVGYHNGRPMMQGRGRCPMSVLLDGRRMRGMVEEVMTREGEDEIRRRGGGIKAINEFVMARQSVDDLVSTLAVAGIEIYASVAAAPVELQQNAAPETCGIIAIWTGRRQ